jgi:hypothetical protein
MATLLWIFGLLGGGGVVLVIVGMFVPAVGLIVSQFFAFLRTPLGQAAAAIALAVLFFFAGEIHRASVDEATWKAKQLQADNEAKARDANQATLSDADATLRITALEHQHQQDQETINGYKSKISTPVQPGAARACTLGADDLNGL